MAAFGPWLAPQDPTRSVGGAWSAPDGVHLLGTDGLGRDVLSRLLAGGWPVLVVPGLAVALSTALGSAVAMALVALPGRGRRLVRGLDLLLVIPPLLLLVLVSVGLEPGLAPIVLVIVLVSAPFTVRHLRAAADPVMDRGFVEVARGQGRSSLDVAVREVLPNLRRPLLADAGLRAVGAVYLVATVAYLGVARLPGDVDWATMVSEGVRSGMTGNPAAVLAPLVALIATTVSLTLLADRAADR